MERALGVTVGSRPRALAALLPLTKNRGTGNEDAFAKVNCGKNCARVPFFIEKAWAGGWGCIKNYSDKRFNAVKIFSHLVFQNQPQRLCVEMLEFQKPTTITTLSAYRRLKFIVSKNDLEKYVTFNQV